MAVRQGNVGSETPFLMRDSRLCPSLALTIDRGWEVPPLGSLKLGLHPATFSLLPKSALCVLVREGFVHLLYADESGSIQDASQRHFVLAGFSVFERQTYWIARELDAIAASGPARLNFGAERRDTGSLFGPARDRSPRPPLPRERGRLPLRLPLPRGGRATARQRCGERSPHWQPRRASRGRPPAAALQPQNQELTNH